MKCPIPLEEWPRWANWAAMDKNKSWYFYESKPEIEYYDSAWCNHANKNIDKSPYKGSDLSWEETLTHHSELKNENL